MHLRNRNIVLSASASTTTSSPKKRRRSPRLRENAEKMPTVKKTTGRRTEHTHHMVLRSHV